MRHLPDGIRGRKPVEEAALVSRGKSVITFWINAGKFLCLLLLLLLLLFGFGVLVFWCYCFCSLARLLFVFSLLKTQYWCWVLVLPPLACCPSRRSKRIYAAVFVRARCAVLRCAAVFFIARRRREGASRTNSAKLVQRPRMM